MLKILTFVFLLLSHTSVWSIDVDSILAEDQQPAGIVFEIVSGKSSLLGSLLTALKVDIERLHERFPGLPIAIVTHGLEQFDLTKKNRDKEALAHELVEQLVSTHNVDVHVCGTHAGWYGIDPEDFPDYVNVAAGGPTQIKNYQALGYELIILP